MNAKGRSIYDGESPIDFFEMMVVAWIRLVASAAHACFTWQVPLPEQSAGGPVKASDKIKHAQEEDETEKEELLLHVLE